MTASSPAKLLDKLTISAEFSDDSLGLGFEDSDSESHSNLSFNGKLVISSMNGPYVHRELGGVVVFDERDESSDNELDQHPVDSICRGNSIVRRKDLKQDIKFEIVDLETKIMTEGRKKFVLYTVYVMKTPCVDTDKAVICKRFSEFYKLYKDLKTEFPSIFTMAPQFPKKVIGPRNFDQEVLRSRSRAFEKILQFVYSFDEICEHQIFKEFFYLPDLRDASMYIRGGKFRDALNLLVNAVHLQQKLSDDIPDIVATLGSIVAADIAIDNTEEAEKYAVAAIELIKHDVGNVYLIPLINTAIELRWRLGKDKRYLEEKLKEIKEKTSVEIEDTRTLRQLACSRYSYTR